MIGSRLPNRSGYFARNAWNDECASVSLCWDETCTAYPDADGVSPGVPFVAALATDVGELGFRERVAVAASPPAGTSASGALPSGVPPRPAAPRAAERAVEGDAEDAGVASVPLWSGRMVTVCTFLGSGGGDGGATAVLTGGAAATGGATIGEGGQSGPLDGAGAGAATGAGEPDGGATVATTDGGGKDEL